MFRTTPRRWPGRRGRGTGALPGAGPRSELTHVVVLDDHAPTRDADASNARRLSIGMITPIGNWWHGVTYASRGRRRAAGSFARIETVASTRTRSSRAPPPRMGSSRRDSAAPPPPRRRQDRGGRARRDPAPAACRSPRRCAPGRRRPARTAEVLAERRAERAVPGGRAVAQRIGRRAPRVSGQEPAPDLARELVDRGPAVAEVVAQHRARAGRARRREIEPRGETARIGGDRRWTRHRGPSGRRSERGGATAATDVAPRWRLTRYPSAASCSYASTTVLRDTPRSRARARVDGDAARRSEVAPGSSP